ncbi:MAG TPA: chemotaxis protein CheD [Longimicrobiaceae bacterium]|nr:chemotaxis protein CheD [Longimicrobiaceae bacterium]
MRSTAAAIAPAAFPWADGAPRAGLYLHPGQVVAAARPTAVTTILGSCVSVCLFDELRGVGGINHFLLPAGAADGATAGRFGNGAVPELLRRLERLGSGPGTLRAKVFGGACVLEAFRGGRRHLGQANVEAAHELLAGYGIPVAGGETGGTRGRKLIFHTDDGTCWVRPI